MRNMTGPVNGYKHIIWDWNGTLLDDVDYAVRIMNGILQKRNMPRLSRQSYREVFDFPVVEYYRKMGFDFSADPFEVITEEFVDGYDKDLFTCRLHEGAEETLKTFQAAGLSQSVLSASHQDSLIQYVEHYRISQYFIKLIGLPDNYAAGKMETGRRWVSRLPYHPGEILLIGDTTHDFEVAQAMGCNCALVARGHQTKEKLKSCGVMVYDSLLDFSSGLDDAMSL